MNRPIRKFVTGLFPVSKGAGRLRYTLAALLLFIFWTIIAQSNPVGIVNIFAAPSETNFTGSVIRELLNHYFGISTLLLTCIPFVVFAAALTQAAAFLEALFPEIWQEKAAAQFLVNCAFSCQRNKKHATNIFESNKLLIEQKIGGPAELTINKSDLLITESHDGISHQLFLLGDTQDKHQIHLAHKERIYAFIPKSNLRIVVKLSDAKKRKGNLNTKEMISIDLDISGNAQSTHRSLVSPISKEDAWFLKETANPNNLIHDFFEQEIYKYLRDQESGTLINKIEELNTTQNNKQIAKHQGHGNYSQLLESNPNTRKYFIRKHRRSQYGIYNSTNENEITQTEQTTDSNSLQINELNDHLEKQVVSFFSLSNLSINIIRKG